MNLRVCACRYEVHGVLCIEYHTLPHVHMPVESASSCMYVCMYVCFAGSACMYVCCARMSMLLAYFCAYNARVLV
jgi:hypothetical protein